VREIRFRGFPGSISASDGEQAETNAKTLSDVAHIVCSNFDLSNIQSYYFLLIGQVRELDRLHKDSYLCNQERS
ncbi:MAG: hypothetical protein J6W74_03700, partial [Bacteroidales bacterium]|nr:hypothetical protein [Bacteroidales bacterium]